jgi:hypothetical protein
MNRSKHQMTKANQKKMMKEVRSAQHTVTPESESTGLFGFGRKLRKGVESLLGIKQKIETKKRKNHAKKSRRTNTHDSIVGSAPRHAHIEGERWARSNEKRIVADNKIFKRKVAKTHPTGKMHSLLKGK